MTLNYKCFAGIAVQINHFSPEPDLPMLASTIPQISVILGFFASLLGSKYPYPSLQQAFVPAGISPVSSAGLQILPSTLLFSEQCVEQVFYLRVVTKDYIKLRIDIIDFSMLSVICTTRRHNLTTLD